MSHKVQAVSCDEALLEIQSTLDGGVQVALQIRKAIYEATQCNASIGIANNILLAR